MDEPTSGLDTVTESELMDTLKMLTRGKTTIMIAHRLSTVEMADRVLVLSDGRIVQEGSHADLAGQPGPYCRLLETA
jgi:ABC-type multidrug transport system fused ATPase/permease subunit